MLSELSLNADVSFVELMIAIDSVSLIQITISLERLVLNFGRYFF